MNFFLISLLETVGMQRVERAELVRTPAGQLFQMGTLGLAYGHLDFFEGVKGAIEGRPFAK